MKKLAGLNFIFVWLILSVASLLLLTGSAQAYVYDDFNSPGIDPNLWVDKGITPGLFSQPGDGYLYFNDASGGQDDRLRSFGPVKHSFFVWMQYSKFNAVNSRPPDIGQSTCVEVMLDDGANRVYMMEGKNITGKFFQGQYYRDGSMIKAKYVVTSALSGCLGIRFNGILGPGGKVDFLYKVANEWKVLDSCAPNFKQAPWFSVRGSNQFGASLSFQVHQVQVIKTTIVPVHGLLLRPGK